MMGRCSSPPEPPASTPSPSSSPSPAPTTPATATTTSGHPSGPSPGCRRTSGTAWSPSTRSSPPSSTDTACHAAEKFVQEVFWRTYWKGWLEQNPEVWRRYRREVDELADRRPAPPGYEDALAGRTGIEAMDAWARELIDTGYLHNHTRMWFASIWIFTLELPWQLGADFFYRHLLDGDAASNTLSWRWVAGLQTRGKTYLATASNIARYTDGRFSPTGPRHERPGLDEEPLPAPHAVESDDVDGTFGERVGLLAARGGPRSRRACWPSTPPCAGRPIGDSGLRRPGRSAPRSAVSDAVAAFTRRRRADARAERTLDAGGRPAQVLADRAVDGPATGRRSEGLDTIVVPVRPGRPRPRAARGAAARARRGGRRAGHPAPPVGQRGVALRLPRVLPVPRAHPGARASALTRPRRRGHRSRVCRGDSP